MNNSELLHAVYGDLLPDQYGWVAAFGADPNKANGAEWSGRIWQHKPGLTAWIDSAAALNTFFMPSTLSGLDEQGRFKRTKKHFVRLNALIADDANPADVAGQLSYNIETSPNKHQLCVLLDRDDPDCADKPLVDLVMQSMAAARLIRADPSGNNIVRYVRLPVGSNTKQRPSGNWQVKTQHSNLNVRYGLADACATFGLNLDAIRTTVQQKIDRGASAGSGTDYAALIAALAADDPNERTYHDPLLKLSSKLVASGLQPGAAVEALRGLMLNVKPAEPAQMARWESRYHEIPRLVSSAHDKFVPQVKPAVEQTEQTERGLLLSISQLRVITANVRWLVKNLIPSSSLGMLFGASGTFKSFIGLSLGLHIAHAMSWAKRKTNAGRVVFVAAEGGAGIYRRVAAWHQALQLPETDNFSICITPLLLTLEQQIVQLRDAIKALPTPPVLIVVDTMSATFAGDENAATDIADYLRMLNTHLRAEFNCTVLVIHHTGHSASERPRGSSAIIAGLDFVLGCFRPNPDANSALLEVVKQKDGDKLAAQHFELERQVLGKDEDGDEISSLVAHHQDLLDMIRAAAGKLAPVEQKIIAMMEPGLVVSEDEIAEELRGIVKDTSIYTTRRRAVAKLSELKLIVPAGNNLWTRRIGPA